MKKIRINTEFITLGQLMKYAGIIANGGEIKAFLAQNTVKINGVIDQRRGRKLYSGDQIEVLNEKIELFAEKDDE